MIGENWTPGPWRVTEPNGKGNGMRIEGPGDWPRLPEAWLGMQASSDEQRANALLMASSPDLYDSHGELIDAVESMCKGLPVRNLDERLNRALIVRAKARGVL